MTNTNCQIILVGHSSFKLTLSIDKEIVHKIIFVTEKEKLSGTEETLKILPELVKMYEQRKIEVEHVEFDFHIQTKPIAQLIYLILQQRQIGYKNIVVNISGGLRYMSIWFYIACSLTGTRIIHADYKYEGKEEVGINSNIELITLPFNNITDRQFEFLELFFEANYKLGDFFSQEYSFDDHFVLKKKKKYTSLEHLRKTLEARKGISLTRGSINGYIKKLQNLSTLEISPNPEDRKEKTITISYLGIAFFLQNLYNKLLNT
ncbi:hypothetical protein LCGC14_1817890 [marine sediment metagenome]|uniref:CRISPR system ring nuclease SSO1393-like domain-containing protein n=1 Tax=marine sediment metagenome TaxID=412755 RepID=A0A0F9H7W8_9ZZZZ